MASAVFDERSNNNNAPLLSAYRTTGHLFRSALRAVFGLALFTSLLGSDRAAATEWSMDGDLFPFMNYARFTGLPSGTSLEKDSLTRGADLFGLASYNEWRVLAEVMVDNTEGDPERLQLGRWIGSNTMLWIGRWHTPSAYWDMVYHHSPFLQTSITRPEIMNYEDDGGILPTHIWGLLASETIPQGEGEWQIHLGVGAAPQLAEGALQPVKALTPLSPNNRLGVVGLVSYMPDTSRGDEVGAFVSDIEMPAALANIDGVRQMLGGGYLSWTTGALHTIASLFDVRTRLDYRGAASHTHSFVSGYLFMEYQLTPKWRPYVRYEGSLGTDNDPYIALFPNNALADSRVIGGVRYNLTATQALTLEASHARYNNGLSYSVWMFQWSAMFR